MRLRSSLTGPAHRSFNPNQIDPDLLASLQGAVEQANIRARGGRAISQYAKLQAMRQGGSSPDAAKVEAAYIGYGTLLQDKLKRPDLIHAKMALKLRTNKLLDRQLWIDSVPKMRLWEGDKVLSQLRVESLSVITRPYESSILVPKGDILNDEFGLYAKRISGLGDAYNWHIEETFFAMLIAGLQGTALGTTYDGQNLIDTDHTFLGNGTGTTYSNKVTGAFSAATYQQAWNLMFLMKDENGYPIHSPGQKFYLLHGQPNRIAVRNVLQQENIVGQTATNLDKGTAEPICTPWITPGATYFINGVTVTLTGLEWFLIPEGSSAIMIQVKRDVEFLAVDKGEDEFTFRTGKYLYGIESEDGAAYGLPQEIVGGPGA